MPTTPRRAGRWRSSRTSSATRCCRATRTPTPSRAAPACRPRACVRTPAGSSTRPSVATRRRSSSSPGRARTGAISKLIGVLGLRIPSALEDRHSLLRHIPEQERPVVFIGPFEHHSNEIPWRESIADVVVIPQDADGHIDLDALRAALLAHADRPLKIGSFSAASNVTGIVSDTFAISTLLHEHGALSFWDFAAAAPYIDIEMYARLGHTRWPTRTRSSSRRTSSSVGRRPRACWSPAASCSPTGCPRCRAAAPWPTSTTRSTPTSPSRSIARRAARRPSSRRSGPASSSSSSRRSASRRSGPPRSGSWSGRSPLGVPNPRSRSSATSTPSDSRSSRSSYARRRVAISTTTSSSPCSTTSSASSRVAAAPAPAPTATGCSGSTSSAATSSSARSPVAARGSSRGGCA